MRAVKDRLNTHGKVVMSCMGRDAVHLTMRILRKTVDFYKNVTDPEGASVAFSPQVRRGEDGLVSMDFHVRRVAFAPDEGDLLLKATKDVNQLSKLAGQMVRFLAAQRCILLLNCLFVCGWHPFTSKSRIN